MEGWHTFSVYAGGRHHFWFHCCFLRRVFWYFVRSLVLKVPAASFLGCPYCWHSFYYSIARAFTFALTYEKKEDVFIRGDWRFTWFAERQVCSVVSLSLV